MKKWEIARAAAFLLVLLVIFAAGPASVFIMLERAERNTAEQNTIMATDPNANLTDVEINRLFYTLRSQYLDDRAESITWWLMAAGVSFAFLTVLVTAVGVVIVVAGLFGTRWFREILNESRQYADEAEKSAQLGQNSSVEAARSVEEIRELARQARQGTETIQEQQRIASDFMATFASPVESSGDGLERDQRESEGTDPVIESAIAEATRLQEEGRNTAALEKWQAIAHILDGVDHERATQAWHRVGYLRYQVNEYQLSISAYDKVIAYSPNNVAAHNNRGNANHQLRRYEEAIADYDQAIDINKRYAVGFYNRGNSKYAIGRHEEAIADLDEAVQINPQYAAAYTNRGRIKQNLRRYSDAIADYDEAIRNNPVNALPRHNRGISNHALGNYLDAVDDYDQALRIDAGRAWTHYRRGLALAQLNRTTEAMAALEAALALSNQQSNSALAAQIEQAISELQSSE